MYDQRVLTIGLDAVETPLMLELMKDGRLPSLQALSAKAVSTRVAAPSLQTLPGAVWQDILTGTDSLVHGNFYPTRIHTGEDAVRDIDEFGHVGDYYFDFAAAAGRRVIVVDQPLVPSYKPPVPLTMVTEWHVHDAMFGRQTQPPQLLKELEDKFGTPPWDRCDTNHSPDAESVEAFADLLIRELDTKIDMVEHLMAVREWDLFAVGIGQGHCAGHQFWALHDKVQSGEAGPEARDLLVEVYIGIDQAIGRLVDAAGDASIVLFTSHGMESYIAGPQLLPHLMRSWGYGDPRKIPSGVRRFVPRTLLQKLFRKVPGALRAAAKPGVFNVRLSPETTAVPVPNNRVGAVRFNVVDREPAGAINAKDLATELSTLEERVMGIRDAKTGEPVVDHVVRPHFLPGLPCHPDLPDLLIVFRRDLGEITDVVCPEAGALTVAVRQPDYPRTGDHTDESRIWVRHAGAQSLATMKSTDIAPTILKLVGVETPHEMVGTDALRVKNSTGAGA